MVMSIAFEWGSVVTAYDSSSKMENTKLQSTSSKGTSNRSNGNDNSAVSMIVMAISKIESYVSSNQLAWCV